MTADPPRNTLPDFPVDDQTLDLLLKAVNPWKYGDGDEGAERSSLWDLLDLMSQLGGSDTDAIAEVHDDGSDGGPRVVTMRDTFYHENDVIEALILEIRRLRTEHQVSQRRGYQKAINGLRNLADLAIIDGDDIRQLLTVIANRMESVAEEVLAE